MPDPNKDAPRTVRDRLRNYGGLNPFGQPNWRLCLAQHCLEVCGGIFHNMPDGELAICEEGPDGKLYHRELKPESVEQGFFETPKYAHEGWILEIWMPAHLWGTREWWESQKAEDGLTPLMGPYPERGAYWMMGGPWSSLPDVGDVEMAIAQYRRAQADRPRNLEMALRMRLKEHEARRLKARDEKRKRYEEQAREVMQVLRGTSLGAQRVRDGVQKSIGANAHLGACDF